MKSNPKNLKKRGFISKSFQDKFLDMSREDLGQLLVSNNSQKRTVAAKILGERKEIKTIDLLCDALKTEKSLYSKIAISNALGKMGKQAICPLIKLIGQIGNNQHKQLPTKSFDKLNYPLPRDIAGRTIIKIGENSLPYLETLLLKSEVKQASEAIDVIGHIAFYTKNRTSLPVLFKCLKKYETEELIVWKIIRAFSAFPIENVLKKLQIIVKTSEISAHHIEAKRSLHILSKNKDKNIQIDTK